MEIARHRLDIMLGLSELNAVRSYLRQMLVYLQKIQGWPDNPAAEHSRGEIGAFQADAVQRFVPSMRRRINVAGLYDKARGQLKGIAYDGVSPAAWPIECPFTLNALLREERARLEERLRATLPADQKPGP